MARPPRSALRRLREHARRLAWVGLVVALFTGIGRAGTVYFYCSAMGETRLQPCCERDPRAFDAPSRLGGSAGSEGSAGDDGAAVSDEARFPSRTQIEGADCGCCQAHRLAALPATLTQGPGVPLAAPLRALLPAAGAGAIVVRGGPGHPFATDPWTARPRAGPARATDLVRLQVFRI